MKSQAQKKSSGGSNDKRSIRELGVPGGDAAINQLKFSNIKNLQGGPPSNSDISFFDSSVSDKDVGRDAPSGFLDSSLSHSGSHKHRAKVEEMKIETVSERSEETDAMKSQVAPLQG